MGTECILVVGFDGIEKRLLHAAWFRSDLLLPLHFADDSAEAIGS